MENRLKTLKLIHYLIAAGPAVFLAIAYFLAPDSQDTGILGSAALVVGVALGALALSIMKLFARRAAAMDQDSIPGLYFTAKIVQWSVLEAAAFLNAVVYFMSGPLVNAAVAVILIIILVARPPKPEEMRDSLNYRG